MCDICHQFPHDSRCPYAEPQSICNCEYCGEAIIVGDKYLDVDGSRFHYECAKDIAMTLLTVKCGAKLKVAEENTDGSYKDY